MKDPPINYLICREWLRSQDVISYLDKRSLGPSNYETILQIPLLDKLIQNWAVVIDKRSLKEALVNFAKCPHLNLKVLALHIQIPSFLKDIFSY